MLFTPRLATSGTHPRSSHRHRPNSHVCWTSECYSTYFTRSRVSLRYVDATSGSTAFLSLQYFHSFGGCQNKIKECIRNFVSHSVS